MTKKAESRIDKWIDSRLENLKEEGRTITRERKSMPWIVQGV